MLPQQYSKSNNRKSHTSQISGVQTLQNNLGYSAAGGTEMKTVESKGSVFQKAPSQSFIHHHHSHTMNLQGTQIITHQKPKSRH